MRNASPRIVTDEKVPCLVVACRLDKQITSTELASLLSTHFERVSNVYNCLAFRLDEKCEELIAINSLGQISIVLFLNEPAPVESDMTFRQLEGRLRADKKLIDQIIQERLGSQIIFESTWIEITGRTPN